MDQERAGAASSPCTASAWPGLGAPLRLALPCLRPQAGAHIWGSVPLPAEGLALGAPGFSPVGEQRRRCSPIPYS